MKKLVLAPIALAVLAGCASEDKATSAPPPVVVAPVPAPAPVVVAPAATAVPLRPGIGFVTSITSAPASAAAGGTAGSSTKRVGIRMADNTIQYVDTRAVGLEVGQRVEITPDGNLRHPAP